LSQNIPATLCSANTEPSSEDGLDELFKRLNIPASSRPTAGPDMSESSFNDTPKDLVAADVLKGYTNKGSKSGYS
jgi:hypothetical protein